MDDDHQLIIIAGYGDIAVAREDFEELKSRAEHGMEARAAALVTKSAEGQPEVIEAANRHGR
ncbi:MAG: sulfatase, partial [Mycobacteriaceae bacterium]|nr:sulfatase [Mycobacteriaceae bacterium]